LCGVTIVALEMPTFIATLLISRSGLEQSYPKCTITTPLLHSLGVTKTLGSTSARILEGCLSSFRSVRAAFWGGLCTVSFLFSTSSQRPSAAYALLPVGRSHDAGMLSTSVSRVYTIPGERLCFGSAGSKFGLKCMIKKLVFGPMLSIRQRFEDCICILFYNDMCGVPLRL
jgi:hypothetical protein